MPPAIPARSRRPPLPRTGRGRLARATRRISLAVLASILVACSGAGRTARPATPEPAGRRGIDAITVLHTNDIHGHASPEPHGIAGLAKVAAYMNAVRAGRRDVLVLDGGDIVSGTPLSSLTEGRAIVDLMNLLRIDAGVIGNHEYDHGWRHIPEYVERATYPILCANAFTPDGRLLADAPTRVIDVDGVRVGILGLITDHTPSLTTTRNNAGIRFEAPIEAARRLVPELERTSDLVIALTHIGLDEDRRLARAVPGIDLIVGGHTHTELPKPVRIDNTWIVQAHEYTKKVGRIDLQIDLDAGRVISAEGGLVAPAELPIPPDPEMAAAVLKAEASIEGDLGAVLAVASRDLGKRDLQALIEAALREATGAELVMMNDGGIRGDLAAGPITLRALWSVLPFDNSVVRTRIDAARINAKFRERLQKRGVTLEPGRTYLFATNSYVAEHADSFLGPGLTFEDTGSTLRDTVADYLKRRGQVP